MATVVFYWVFPSPPPPAPPLLARFRLALSAFDAVRRANLLLVLAGGTALAIELFQGNGNKSPGYRAAVIALVVPALFGMVATCVSELLGKCVARLARSNRTEDKKVRRSNSCVLLYL